MREQTPRHDLAMRLGGFYSRVRSRVFLINRPVVYMKPSVQAIFWNDWPALACWIGIPILWAIYSAFPLLRRGASIGGEFILLPIVVMVMLGCILVWRVQRVRGLFERGVEVSGEVLGVFITKDRGRLEYAYEWKDDMLVSWSPVHKTKRVLGFSFRQPVRVLVDPYNPKQSVVRELFE